MIKTALRLVLVAGSFAAMQAHAITVKFTGVVNDVTASNATAPSVGETVSGWYVFNGDVPGYSTYGDGTSYAERITPDNSGANALAIYGSAVFSDGTVLRLDSSNISSLTGQAIYRNYSGYYNDIEYFAQTYTTGNNTTNYLDVYGYDTNGASSSLFVDPSAGLSFSQGIDPTGAGVNFGGSFQSSTANGYYWGDFTATSVTISAIPEAGNLALLLSGLGLVGIAARRRQQAARG